MIDNRFELDVKKRQLAAIKQGIADFNRLMEKEHLFVSIELSNAHDRLIQERQDEINAYENDQIRTRRIINI